MKSDHIDFSKSKNSVSLYDSIQDCLKEFRHIYIPKSKITFETCDLHLMLFDPSDGCYHQYISSSVADLRINDLLDIKAKLTANRKNLKLDDSFNWIESNVSENKNEKPNIAKEIAKNIIIAAKDGSDLPLENPNEDICREVLQIILSSFPNSPYWDVCGFYHREFEKKALDFILWEYDNNQKILYATDFKNDNSFQNISCFENTCNDFDSVFKLKVNYSDFQNYLYDDEPLEEKNQRKLRRIQNGYDDLYDALIDKLLPSKSYAISRSIHFSHLFYGVLFIMFDKNSRLKKLIEKSEKREMSNVIQELRVESHRDFIPFLLNLQTNEFDKKIYQGISEYKSIEEIIKIFCQSINYIIRCELVVLKMEGHIKKIFGWAIDKDYVLKSSFQKLHDASSMINQIYTHLNKKNGESTPFVYNNNLCLLSRIPFVLPNKKKYEIVLVTKEVEDAVNKSGYGQYLKLFKQQRFHLLIQKIQSIFHYLEPQIELMERKNENDTLRYMDHFIINNFQSFAKNQNKISKELNDCSTNKKVRLISELQWLGFSLFDQILRIRRHSTFKNQEPHSTRVAIPLKQSLQGIFLYNLLNCHALTQFVEERLEKEKDYEIFKRLSGILNNNIEEMRRNLREEKCVIIPIDHSFFCGFMEVFDWVYFEFQNSKNYNLTLSFNENVYIYIVLNEIFTNVMKFWNQNFAIQLNVQEEDNAYRLLILTSETIIGDDVYDVYNWLKNGNKRIKKMSTPKNGMGLGIIKDMMQRISGDSEHYLFEDVKKKNSKLFLNVLLFPKQLITIL